MPANIGNSISKYTVVYKRFCKVRTNKFNSWSHKIFVSHCRIDNNHPDDLICNYKLLCHFYQIIFWRRNIISPKEWDEIDYCMGQEYSPGKEHFIMVKFLWNVHHCSYNLNLCPINSLTNVTFQLRDINLDLLIFNLSPVWNISTSCHYSLVLTSWLFTILLCRRLKHAMVF